MGEIKREAATTEPEEISGVFSGLISNDLIAKQLRDRSYLDTSLKWAMLSWVLTQDRLPASAGELANSHLIPFLPADPAGNPLQLRFGGAAQVLGPHELQLDFSTADWMIYRMSRNIGPTNPEGNAGGVNITKDVLEYAQHIRTEYKQDPKPKGELLAMQADRQARGLPGLSASNVIQLSDQFNERRLWCLLQAVKESMLIYRNATGAWPADWDQVLQLMDLVPVESFFASQPPEDVAPLIATVRIDPASDRWMMELTPTWGAGTQTVYWRYEEDGPESFRFQVLSHGSSDASFSTRPPAWKELISWRLHSDPIPN